MKIIVRQCVGLLSMGVAIICIIILIIIVVVVVRFVGGRKVIFSFVE